MSDLKYILLLLLLLPAISLAQTIHVAKDTVVYEGKLAFYSPVRDDVYNRAKNLLLSQVNANPDSLIEKRSEKELSTTTSIRLPSPYHIIKKLHYRVKLKASKEEIGYEVSDIFLSVRERGKKAKLIPAEHLLKGITENGKVAMTAETELNQIDMNIQKLIATMKAEVKM